MSTLGWILLMVGMLGLLAATGPYRREQGEVAAISDPTERAEAERRLSANHRPGLFAASAIMLVGLVLTWF